MDQLSKTLAAIAHPTRRAILLRLAQGEATVNELAAPFDVQLPTISRHLKVLRGAGLVSLSRNAQFRRYQLEVGPLREVEKWVWTYRTHWDEGFERLDELLAATDDPAVGKGQ